MNSIPANAKPARKLPRRKSRAIRVTPIETDEVQLAIAAATGDEAAATALLARFEGLFRAIALEYAPDAAQADDLAQECKTHLLRQLHHYDTSRPLRPWLQTVARNCARNYCRSARRWRARPFAEDAPELVSSIGTPADGAQHDETLAQVRRLVGELPDLYRTVIERKYFGDDSCETISRALGIPVGTVKNRLFRARQMLHDRLAPVAAP